MQFLLAEFLRFRHLVAVVKLVHFVDGVFVQVLISLLDIPQPDLSGHSWEFLSTLYFEWGVFTGKRQPKFAMIVSWPSTRVLSHGCS